MAHTESKLLVKTIMGLKDKQSNVCNIHTPVQHLFARTVVPLALGFDKETTEGIVMLSFFSSINSSIFDVVIPD